MSIAKFFEPLIRDLTTWSPWHYVFDFLISLLLATVFKWLAGLTTWQALWIGVLVFGVVASGMMMYRHRRVPITYQDFVEMECIRDMARATDAVLKAMEMIHVLIEQCPAASCPTFKDSYKNWRSMTRAYLRGTLQEEIADTFDKRAQNLDDPAVIKMYLVGLVNNLTKYDLRKPL